MAGQHGVSQAHPEPRGFERRDSAFERLLVDHAGGCDDSDHVAAPQARRPQDGGSAQRHSTAAAGSGAEPSRLGGRPFPETGKLGESSIVPPIPQPRQGKKTSGGLMPALDRQFDPLAAAARGT
jgi:hypothetical protein